MVEDGKEGFLFQCGDANALAHAVLQIFDETEQNPQRIEVLSKAERTRAKIAHDPECNYQRMLEIYGLICE